MTHLRLTTAQALVRYLGAQHSERDGERRRLIPGVFGIFGHGNVAALGHALSEAGDALPYRQARDEQSMVHIACAFAKATRRRATFACTSSIGPGATNMVTGAALAATNRLPVLLLPGDTYATRRQGPVLQQLEHPLHGDVSVNDCFRPVARFFDRIQRPEQLLTALPEAMRILTSAADTGPVVIALPQDVQAEAEDFPAAFFAERTWRIERPPAPAASVRQAAELLAAAERPLLIAGGGVHYSEAEAELAALAEQLDLPVAETFGGKGAAQQEAWWALGGIGLEGNPACNEIAARADLVIAVGTRLTDFATASQSLFQHPDVRFVAINVNDRDAHKQGALSVVGDAREALRALAAAMPPCERPALRAEIAALTERWREDRKAALFGDERPVMTQGQLIGVLQDSTRPGDTVIAAAGSAPGDLLKVWDAAGGRHCHLEFGFSCMGYELPATLGVRLAQPTGEVIALLGDGTFLMRPSELTTALQEGLRITVVIAENHGFQVIRRLQVERTGSAFGNEFRERVDGLLGGTYLRVDLAQVAEGLGATTFRARTRAELRAALAAARDVDGPAAIVVETAPHEHLPGAGAWWDVAPPEVSDDPAVRTLRASYEADRDRLQRFHG